MMKCKSKLANLNAWYYLSGRNINNVVCVHVDSIAVVEGNMFSTVQFLFLFTSFSSFKQFCCIEERL